MQFPEAKIKTLYEKPIIRQIICQLRFPAILSVNESPIKFQESIREEFPGFEENIEQEIKFRIGPQFNSIQKPVYSDQSLFNKKNYRFSNKENDFSINLTDRFIAFSSIAYSGWDSFSETLAKPLQNFIDIYKPAYFERIGLRLINLINRKQLGIPDSKLVNLVKPEISNSLNLIGEKEDLLQDFINEIRFKLDNDDSSTNIHIIIKLVTDPSTGEEHCLIFDYDLYSELQIEVKKGEQEIHKLHKHAWDFFRWSISDGLHEAMLPTK